MITNAEWKIMWLLWQKPYQTLTELTEALYTETKWAKHTVLTMLKRLTDKNVVNFEQGKRAKRFYPLLTQEEASKTETEAVLRRAFHGSPSLMVSALVKCTELDDKERMEIEKILGIAKE